MPKRGQGDVAARLATFKAEAERAQASVTEVREWADAPAEIARYLRESNCPATLRMGDDPRLGEMPWGVERERQCSCIASVRGLFSCKPPKRSFKD